MPELRQNIVDDLSSVTTESWRTFRIMAEMVLEWLRKSMAANGFIHEAEIDKLVTVCDTPEEVVNHLCKIIIL